jgi:hypothetical protein
MTDAPFPRPQRTRRKAHMLSRVGVSIELPSLIEAERRNFMTALGRQDPLIAQAEHERRVAQMNSPILIDDVPRAKNESRSRES